MPGRGRPCLICSDATKWRLAAELFAAGSSDQVVANRLSIARSSVQRHRVAHAGKPEPPALVTTHATPEFESLLGAPAASATDNPIANKPLAKKYLSGRTCGVCKDPSKIREAARMIAAGATDQAIADRLQITRTSVNRHRLNHVIGPAKALVQAAEKDAPARAERAQMLAAAEAGDPLAFVALNEIVNDLRVVHQRLERTADAAEQDKQRLAVASLSSQQLRAAEVRAKIGGHGGYGPTKGREGADVPAFSLTINLSGGRTERLEMRPADDPAPAPFIDLQPDTTVVRNYPTMLPDDEFGDEGGEEA